MKKFLFVFFSIFACLVLSSCSDEFGCMSISCYWSFYLPEAEANKVYKVFDNKEKTEIRKYPKDKDGYDLFFENYGEELQTRRDYTETIKVYIEYVDGTSEEIEVTVEIPYLEDDAEDKTIVVPSKKFTEGIECNFDYRFSRWI